MVVCQLKSRALPLTSGPKPKAGTHMLPSQFSRKPNINSRDREHEKHQIACTGNGLADPTPVTRHRNVSV